MTLILHVDGGARGNPGPAGAGVVISDANDQALFEAGYFLGEQTNNSAEYLGLVHGLQQAQRFAPAELHIYADSELLVKQITGEYRIKSERLRQLYEQVQFLLVKIGRWQIRHVRRNKNERADELANLAMDRQADVVVTDTSDASAVGEAVANDAPEPVAQPPQSEQEPQVVLPPPGARGVSVKIVTDPRKSGACPAGLQAERVWTIRATLPEGMCLFAAHAMLPTLMGMQNTEAAEFAAIPAMTVRCANPDCAATFQITPVVGSNGASQE